MLFIVVVNLGLAPGIFWLWFFYRKDRWEPEPKRYIAKTFLLGGLSGLVAGVLESPLDFSDFVLVIIAASIVEECLKFFVVRRTVYNSMEFDEPFDGIIYAAAAALGFASLENPIYLYDAYRNPDPEFSPYGPDSQMASQVRYSDVGSILGVAGFPELSRDGVRNLMGDSIQNALRVRFDRLLKLEFHGAKGRVTLDSSPIANSMERWI